MSAKTFDEVEVGDLLEPLTLPPIDRLSLALYCGGSNDHNPIHIDPDAAQSAGLDGVIAHGMLSMAFVGRLLTSWVEQRRVRKFSCRFVGMMMLGDVPMVSGEVAEKIQKDGENLVRLTLSLKDETGQEKVSAEALVAFS